MNIEHRHKVARVAAEVEVHFSNKTPFKIFHGSTNSTRILAFKRSEMIDVSDFSQIISVDIKAQTIVVEPNVPMDKLVGATLKYGLIPPVVPEFPGITVGGAIQGGAGESSSFRWGFFSQNVSWVDMVLADGTIVRCSPTEHADLFYGAAGSMGTLGIITAAEVSLVPSKRYVNLTYLPVTSFNQVSTELLSLSKKSYDFIDCIMFGSNNGRIILGEMSDKPHGKVSKFSRAVDEWYYIHVAKINATKDVQRDSVPLADYLFRYDRGAFWVGKYAFERFGIPYNRLTRFLLNPLLHTRELYKALQESGASQEHLVQDLTVPLSNATEFMNYIDRSTKIYPLWICPVKPELRSPFMCNSLDTNLAINIGIWGPNIPKYQDFLKINRQLETKLTKLGGKKWMYAQAFYPKSEFWKIYDLVWYTRLREKYKATTLPDIYQKVCANDRVKIDARRGILKTLFGRAKLEVRD